MLKNIMSDKIILPYRALVFILALSYWLYQFDGILTDPFGWQFRYLTIWSLTTSLFADVIRHPLPNNSTFPISRAVEVSPDTTIIYHSGQLPSPANPDAERGTREWAGDTEAQTMSVLKKFENSFKSLGVDFGDAVKLTVFLVGDPCLLYTSPSPRDKRQSRMPSSA